MQEMCPTSSRNESVMVEVTLSYQNQEFTTFVTPTLLKVLELDQNTLESYAKLVFEKEFGQKQMESNLICNDENFSNKQGSSALEDEKFQWTAKSISLLIDTRLSMEKDFIKPTCSKKKLWKIVVETLTNHKYKVTEVLCDSKYRNLLHTYRTNKKKQQTSGEESITWEYFEKFDKVLGHKESSHPSQNNLGASMPLQQMDISSEDGAFRTNNSINNDVSEEGGNEDTGNVQNIPPNQPPVKKRKLEILSMGRYLYLKNERMEEIERKKQQFRAEKWEEEKELRRIEIGALNRLAEALRSSND